MAHVKSDDGLDVVLVESGAGGISSARICVDTTSQLNLFSGWEKSSRSRELRGQSHCLLTPRSGALKLAHRRGQLGPRMDEVVI
jgi:hypothetical protein